MQIIQFEIEHFDMMEVGRFVNKENRDIYAAYPKVGPAITLINDLMEPVASAGMLCIWQGVGEFWMIPSTLVPKYKLSVWKEAKLFLADCVERFRLHRIQATVREKDETALRWIERLGFEKEGLMRCFGSNKENHFIYARVQDV